jgi:hypothetical protein
MVAVTMLCLVVIMLLNARRLEREDLEQRKVWSRWSNGAIWSLADGSDRRQALEKYGRHEETRTPDLYRVNLETPRNSLKPNGTDGVQNRFQSPEKALSDSHRTDDLTDLESQFLRF